MTSKMVARSSGQVADSEGISLGTLPAMGESQDPPEDVAVMLNKLWGPGNDPSGEAAAVTARPAPAPVAQERDVDLVAQGMSEVEVLQGEVQRLAVAFEALTRDHSELRRRTEQIEALLERLSRPEGAPGSGDAVQLRSWAARLERQINQRLNRMMQRPASGPAPQHQEPGERSQQG